MAENLTVTSRVTLLPRKEVFRWSRSHGYYVVIAKETRVSDGSNRLADSLSPALSQSRGYRLLSFLHSDAAIFS
jgi:hypothetical protein